MRLETFQCLKICKFFPLITSGTIFHVVDSVFLYWLVNVEPVRLSIMHIFFYPMLEFVINSGLIFSNLNLKML